MAQGKSSKSGTREKGKRIEFRLIGNPTTPRRDCAGCTACCTVLDVPELDAPQYVSCRHMIALCGCGIHKERPPICRNYHCEWARGFAPEWMKPNECGVIPGQTADNKAMQLWELWPQASLSPRIQQFIRHSNARGINVVVGVYPSSPAEQDTNAAVATSPATNTSIETAPGLRQSPPVRNRVYLTNGAVQEFDGHQFQGTFALLTTVAAAHK